MFGGSIHRIRVGGSDTLEVYTEKDGEVIFKQMGS